MKKIIITPENNSLNLPNLTKNFGNDIEYLISVRRNETNGNFHLANELGYIIVYYAVELCFEFQTQGFGSVPVNIKNDVINQVVEGVEIFFRIDNDFKESIKDKFNNIVEHPFIVDEAIEYLEKIKR